MLKILSDKTLAPLGLSVFVIGGATWWLCSLDFRVEAAEKRIQSDVEYRKQVILLLDSMNQRLSSIEGKMEVVLRRREK